MRSIIDRPVFAVIFFSIVILLGIFSFMENPPIELTPDADLPSITIRYLWAGAGPELVLQKVLIPAEAEIAQLKKVSKIESAAQEGQGYITVEFTRDAKMNFMTVLVSERLNKLHKQLPRQVTEPQIIPFVPDDFKQQPLMTIGVVSKTFSLLSLRQIAEKQIEPYLKSVLGVERVELVGGVEPEIKIKTDQNLLKKMGITIDMIYQKIAENYYNSPSISLQKNGKEITLALSRNPYTIQDIQNVLIMKAGISNIYLKDIADVYYGYEDMATEMRFNGNSVIAFRVVKESKHNSFLVADRLKKQLQQLANRFNKTVDFIIQSDESKILWDNLIRLIKIAILVLMIIFAILILIFRDFKAALLIFSSVFFSVFTTFTFIYLFKIPVNLLTLSGLALGFGMFVDNAVVVFDSMARFREQGMEKREAAIIGAKTVVLPVIASSFTTIIVFFSFAFFEGRLRVYYLPLAYVIAISLLSSIVVSFVLIPTLGTRVKVRIREKKDYFKKGRILPFVFRYPLTVIVPILFLLIFSYKTFKKEVSFGQFFSFSSQEKLQVFLRFSTNVEFQDIKDAILKFEEIAMSKTYNKEVETYILAMSGNSFASMVITFPKHIENSALPLQLKQELVGVASNLAGVGVYVAGFDQEPYMYFPDSRGNLPYSVQIKGYNYEKLMEFCGQLKTYLLNNRRIKDVEIDTSKQFRGSAKKYYSLNLNKEKLKQFRITRPLNVIYIITSLMKEKTNTLKLKFDEREMSLEIKASDIEELELDDILDMNYFTEDQIPYRIRDLVNVKLTVQRGEIARENQEFVAFMRWDYMGSARAADRFHQTVYNNLTVPAGFKKSLEEKTYMMSREEEQQLFVAILISLVLIYLMLGILYENFFQPLLILLSFPLALIGVFMGYVWLDYNFDSKAYIGVILLGGIVVNNAILLIDNINRHKELCKDIVTAIVIGTKERIRPIMITTATTVLGMVPLLDFGSKTSGSSDIWSSLALCVVGGLTTSAGLILIVLPVFYYLFYKMQDYLFNK